MLGSRHHQAGEAQSDGESSTRPLSWARAPQRCYGHFAESSGVKRFRSIVPSSSPIDHLDWRTSATASVSQGPTFSHTTQATTHPLTHSPDMRSDISSPLSSPPASPRELPSPCGSTSSSLSSEAPFSIFDHDSAVKPSWAAHNEAVTSPATSPMASSSQHHSSGKRGRGQKLLDSLRGSSSGTSGAEPTLAESSAGGRVLRRIRRAPNREPTVVHKVRDEATAGTSLAPSDQASASSPSTAEARWNVWNSVSPPSAKPMLQRRRVAKPDMGSNDRSKVRKAAVPAASLAKRVGVGRGRTPTTSSESHSAILAQSQSRPEPPENHPGRSKSHAKQQVDSVPCLLRNDGTIEVSYEDEEEDDADDVVYELLKGHARTRPKRKLREGGVDEDEVAAFFNDQSAQVAAAKRVGKLAGGGKAAYWLPARELPVKSFYARTKREEKSPTPEIRAVQRAQWKITSSVLKSRGATRGVGD